MLDNHTAQGLPPTRVKPTQGLAQVSDPQAPPLTKSRAAYLILKRQMYGRAGLELLTKRFILAQ